MSVDWSSLNARAETYRSLHVVRDTDGITRDVVFCGLQVSLSEIVRGFPAGGAATLTIYADSLVVDRPSFDAAGVVVVARSVDVTQLQGGAMAVRVPAASAAGLEFLIGETVGGTLQLARSNAREGDTASVFRVDTGIARLQTVRWAIDAKSGITRTKASDAPALQDLLARTWAYNSLKSSLTAASWLLDSGNADDRHAAASMLRWVVACTAALPDAVGEAVAADIADMHSQAAALLITIDMAPGTHHLPVLSPGFYGDQVNSLLSAMAQYESHARMLVGQQNLPRAMAEVSAALQGASNDEIEPLQTQLDTIEASLASLRLDMLALDAELRARQITAETRLTVLQVKLADQQTLSAVISALCLVFNLVKAGVSLAGKEPKAGDSIGALMQALKNAKEIYDAARMDSPDSTLVDRAEELFETQSQIIMAFVCGTQLWNEPQAETTRVLATAPSGEMDRQADPSLAWDNYVVEVRATLANLRDEVGSGIGAHATQVAINDYAAALESMAQYAKALDAKLLVGAAQAAQGRVVKDQIRAARTTQARWQELQASAHSEEEKLAALKGIVQVRIDSVRRAVFAAWVNYRSSYFYLYFREPPHVVNLGMDAAALTLAFAGIRNWVATLRGDTPLERQVVLPNDQVRVVYRFKIVGASAGTSDDPGHAQLTPRRGPVPASLSWAISAGDRQMAGVLPDGGQVAMWIREARFFVEGATPNSKGNVIVAVSTSGTCENGFGAKRSHRFVAKAMVGNYAYHVRTEEVYNPWSIDAEVYARPTPFTQWHMVFDADGGDPADAGWLRMELTIAYRRAGPAHG